VFQITSDTDDTGMNMVIGSMLNNFNNLDKMDLSKLQQFWNKNHSHFEDLFDLVVKYSYCPSSTDINKNVIDTRTY